MNPDDDGAFHANTDTAISFARGISDSFAIPLRRQRHTLHYETNIRSTPVGGAMTDVLDLELYDPVVLAELVLTADLMIVANSTKRHMSQEAIDVALGLTHVSRLPA